MSAVLNCAGAAAVWRLPVLMSERVYDSTAGSDVGGCCDRCKGCVFIERALFVFGSGLMCSGCMSGVLHKLAKLFLCLCSKSHNMNMHRLNHTTNKCKSQCFF